MTDDSELLTHKEKAALFNEFVRRQETTLQLHALRYDAAERSHELFSKSAIMLNGGALLIILTTERLKQPDDALLFAGWFVFGTIAFLIGAFSRYISKRNLMNSGLTYFPELSVKEAQVSRIKHDTNYLGETSVIFLFLSILMFSLGCGHGFIVMSGALGTMTAVPQ